MHTFSNSGSIENIPEGWELRTVNSLCKRVTSGGTPSRKNPAFYRNGSIPWFKTQELNGWYIEDALEHITQEALENSSAKLFPPETVLMAMYGDGRTITSLAILRQQGATNQACCAMIVDESQCDNRFLLYALEYHKRDFILLASGGSQRNLNVTTIKNFALKVPPMRTQRKIAAVLSAYDDLIENNGRRITILEEMAQRLYREWFVHFRYPGHEAQEMVAVDGRHIPAGWTIDNFKSHFNIDNGFAFKSKDYSEEGTTIVRTKDFSSSTYIDIQETIKLPDSMLAKYKKYSLQRLDFLMIMVGASLGKYGIVYEKDLPSLQNQNMWAIRPKDTSPFSRYFVLGFMPNLIPDVLRYATGAARSYFRKGHFQQQAVLVPPINILQMYDNKVQPIVDLIGMLLAKNENLRQQRDLLLPRLISGQIDVSGISMKDEG